jgi:F420-non-reducing hydrogenase iron-sulfur subunit
MPGGGVSSQDKVAATTTRVTIFRCAAYPHATAPIMPRGTDDPARPSVVAQEVALPCSGRLQPAHLLRAFETGADAVCVVTCADGDCLYLEGGLRLERRLRYVRGLLDEIGIGGERLMLFKLPPAAQQQDGGDRDELAAEIAAKLATVGPSPLRQNASPPAER